MAVIHLHDSVERRKRAFVPGDSGRVSMYVCGPTVYSRAHIGNARPVVVFDTLFRLLRHEYGQASVVYVRNITDIDDKIIAAARASGRSIEAGYAGNNPLVSRRIARRSARFLRHTSLGLRNSFRR